MRTACKQQAAGLTARTIKADVSATLADFLRPPHVLPFQWRSVLGSRKARRFLGPGLSTRHATATPV